VTPKKKVWILDGGSLVIDRSQVLWPIDVGTPVRFPVNSHFHFDHVGARH
jgi:glyoxylase-like metal-dependent hydrolase (beta-lactamase superfamily II)